MKKRDIYFYMNSEIRAHVNFYSVDKASVLHDYVDRMMMEQCC